MKNVSFCISEPQKVVGTNYSRVIPSKEINSKDRDNFWKKEEEEERIRTEAERAKQTNAKLELEKVRYFVITFFFINACQSMSIICFISYRRRDCVNSKSTLNVKKEGLKRRPNGIPMELKWTSRGSKYFFFNVILFMYLYSVVVYFSN